jgi:hypothetical protein
MCVDSEESGGCILRAAWNADVMRAAEDCSSRTRSVQCKLPELC